MTFYHMHCYHYAATGDKVNSLIMSSASVAIYFFAVIRQLWCNLWGKYEKIQGLDETWNLVNM
jgi:hypothetical protein